MQGQYILTIKVHIPYETHEDDVREAAEVALSEDDDGGIFENVEVQRVEDARTVYNA